MAASPERIDQLLAQLRHPEDHQRIVAAEELGRLPEGSDPIVRALEDVVADDVNPYVRDGARKALLSPALQPFIHMRPTEPTPAPVSKPRLPAEQREASNVYRWLWLSPLLTVPTAIFLIFNDPSYEWICGGRYSNCDYDLSFKVTILVVFLGSALWHLLLLRPALLGRTEFIRWHGRQALLLAGIRTAIPLGFGLAFGEDFGLLCFIPVLLAVWLFGTLWAQSQAARGDCTLMRWFGYGEDLPMRRPAAQPEGQAASPLSAAPRAGAQPEDAEAMVQVIRFSRDLEERRKALAALERLGMVEPL